MIVPGEGFLFPSSRAQGLSGGGGGGGRLNEIDTCICHRHAKSDIAIGPSQSTKLTTQLLKCVELFQLQRQRSYGSKRTIKKCYVLSVVQLVRPRLMPVLTSR